MKTIARPYRSHDLSPFKKRVILELGRKLGEKSACHISMRIRTSKLKANLKKLDIVSGVYNYSSVEVKTGESMCLLI